MDRSLSFGSAASYYVALLRLAFATAPRLVNLATDHNSQAHYAKGSPSPFFKEYGSE